MAQCANLSTFCTGDARERVDPVDPRMSTYHACQPCHANRESEQIFNDLRAKRAGKR